MPVFATIVGMKDLAIGGAEIDTRLRALIRAQGFAENACVAIVRQSFS